jgi:hypothetical protein
LRDYGACHRVCVSLAADHTSLAQRASRLFDVHDTIILIGVNYSMFVSSILALIVTFPRPRKTDYLLEDGFASRRKLAKPRSCARFFALVLAR